MEDATIGTKAEPAQPFDNPPAASPCRKSCAASVLIGAVLLILITLVVYSPIRHAGFIWDDDDYVTRNTTLSEPGGLARIWFKLGATPQYYPLVFSSFWIEHKLWAFNPLGYHCVNVVLHALSAVLVWLVLRRLALPGAWVAAAIFALHPVQAESVAWVTERKNVLSLVFALGSTLAWLGYLRIGDAHPERAHSRGLYVLSLVLFACALLSKTVVCTLPVVLGVVLWWKREKLRAGELLSLAPMLAMGAGMGLLTRWMEHRMVGAHGELFNFSFVERCLIAGRAAWFYFDKLVWPSKLVFIYERWSIDTGSLTAYLYPLTAALAIAVLFVARRRIGKGPLAAALMFCILLSPALGFISFYPMRFSFVADHFQYHASIAMIAGLVALVASRLGTAKNGDYPLFVASARNGDYPLFVGAVVVLVVLGAMTRSQLGRFHDRETLWKAVVERNPKAWIAHNNLGTMLMDRDELDEAVKHFTAAIEADPKADDAEYNLGLVFQRQNNLQEAEPHFRKALQENPRNVDASDNLAYCLAKRGQIEEAIAQYGHSVQVVPDDADAYFNIGVLRGGQSRHTEAVEYYRKAAAVAPKSLRFQGKLAVLLIRLGRDQEAVVPIQAGLQVAKDWADGHFLLGYVQSRQEQAVEAMASFREAMKARPDWPEPMNALAWILATSPDDKLRNGAEAVQLASQACAATGNSVGAMLDTLAAAQAEAGRFDEAVSTAQKALQAVADQPVDPEGLRPAIEQRIALYQQKKPFRGPSSQCRLMPLPAAASAPATGPATVVR